MDRGAWWVTVHGDHKESDMTEQLTHTHKQKSFPTQMVMNLPAIQETWVRSLGQEDPPREKNGYPLQYSCLENSMDRGAWWATIYLSMGSQRVEHN